MGRLCAGGAWPEFAALRRDGHAAHGLDATDDDLALLGELIDLRVHGDFEG
jgi:hypothetical protein